MGHVAIKANSQSDSPISSRGIEVTDDKGLVLKGISKITINAQPDDVIRAELELFPVGIDMAAEGRYVMRHPFFGEKFPVERIIFADGSPDWVAPAPSPPEPPSWEVLDTILQLIGYSVSEETYKTWTDAEKIAAEQYAGAVHLHASDNDDVVVPPKPAVLVGDSWGGPEEGSGAMSGPGPTVL